MTLTLAHISDLHIGQDHDGDGGARALRRAQQVVDYLDALPGHLDGVLLTGDIADHGTADEYRVVRDLVGALRFPVLTCPGNHDVRGPYRTTLLGEPDGHAEPVNQVHQLAGFTIAMCDSSIPGRDDGLLDDTTLTWLDKVLSDTEDPTLVCFHHPPVKLHHPYVDDICLGDEERLADLLNDRVAAILCGHAHTAATTTFAGRPLVVAPGVVSTSVLPFESDGVVSFDLPPALAFHVFDEHGLVTHFRSL